MFQQVESRWKDTSREGGGRVRTSLPAQAGTGHRVAALLRSHPHCCCCQTSAWGLQREESRAGYVFCGVYVPLLGLQVALEFVSFLSFSSHHTCILWCSFFLGIYANIFFNEQEFLGIIFHFRVRSFLKQFHLCPTFALYQVNHVHWEFKPVLFSVLYKSSALLHLLSQLFSWFFSPSS